MSELNWKSAHGKVALGNSRFCFFIIGIKKHPNVLISLRLAQQFSLLVELIFESQLDRNAVSWGIRPDHRLVHFCLNIFPLFTTQASNVLGWLFHFVNWPLPQF